MRILVLYSLSLYILAYGRNTRMSHCIKLHFLQGSDLLLLLQGLVTLLHSFISEATDQFSCPAFSPAGFVLFVRAPSASPPSLLQLTNSCCFFLQCVHLLRRRQIQSWPVVYLPGDVLKLLHKLPTSPWQTWVETGTEDSCVSSSDLDPSGFWCSSCRSCAFVVLLVMSDFLAVSFPFQQVCTFICSD